MYLGRIVELSPRAELFADARHPYTQALLRSVPSITAGKRRVGKVLQGDPPSPLDPPTGCHFHPRCPHATDVCRTETPALTPTGDRLRWVACHHSESVS
jgi:oligopeptide/dipeptide ABC transporter ATP-binding protein